jgi:superfamily II DNA/RNA helicase
MFQSSEGRVLIRKIAQDHGLPFDPHDFTLDAIGALLDQKDVLVRAATGAGKTGIIALASISLTALHQTLRPHPYNVWWPDQPVSIVICPTNALEVNIVSNVCLYVKRNFSV